MPILPAEVTRSLSVPPVLNTRSVGASKPCRAVIIPIESILVTSSYVKVPPMDTLLKVALLKVGSSVNVIVAPTPDAVAVKLLLTKLIFLTLSAVPTLEPSS